MSSSKEPQHKEDEEATEATTAEDEDTGAQVAPIVKLQEVALSTGEENEHVLLDLSVHLPFATFSYSSFSMCLVV